MTGTLKLSITGGTAAAVICALFAVAASGTAVARGNVGEAAPIAQPPTSAAAPAVAVPQPTTTTTAPVQIPLLVEPPEPRTPTALPAAVPPGDLAAFPDLSWGDSGDQVKLLQARLNQLGFRTGAAPDGRFAAGTWSAVLAFQKFEGLERSGDVTAEVWQHLYQPKGWLPPAQGVTGTRVEVDLDRQVLIALNAEQPGQVVVLNASTGGGYYYTNKDGSTDYAYTPEGSYAIYRRYDGVEVAPLGTLYRPLYFVGGWAVHGSPSVPAYPASHGCVRLSNNDIDWLWDRAPDSMPVTVRATMDPAAVEREQWATLIAGYEEDPASGAPV